MSLLMFRRFQFQFSHNMRFLLERQKNLDMFTLILTWFVSCSKHLHRVRRRKLRWNGCKSNLNTSFTDAKEIVACQTFYLHLYNCLSGTNLHKHQEMRATGMPPV